MLKTKGLRAQNRVRKKCRICVSAVASRVCRGFLEVFRRENWAPGSGSAEVSDLPLQMIEVMGDTNGRGALPSPL